MGVGKERRAVVYQARPYNVDIAWRVADTRQDQNTKNTKPRSQDDMYRHIDHAASFRDFNVCASCTAR